ncbi:MAG: ATP-dependent zinc metalloprotease FtsH [Myxococcales bacterium]|nr:ATP-dependent zinc metalloprotease FtsH [Myxococcales bacterium]
MKHYKSMLVWVVVILGFVFFYNSLKTRTAGKELSFTQFVHRATKADDEMMRVDRITVRGEAIEGQFQNGERFTTTGSLKDLQKDLINAGVEITYEREDANALWISILGTWLPMVLLFVLFFFFMRQLQSGGGRAMSFGKSRAKLLNESTNKVTFDDVAGIEESKRELEEIIHFLRDPKKFTRLGGRIPKGVLLMGSPGTGKTLLARAVAGEAGVPFYSISGSDFVEMFVGVGASRVRDLFEQGKKNAPCIIFIDEIDAVGRHRGAGMGGGHDEREQTLNQLLVEMDGFESNAGVIIMAATNRPDVLDPALLRPGRFDRRVVVPPPDANGREAILGVHTRKVPLAADVDLKVIAKGTPGFSGADLENLVNESALIAARLDKDRVWMEDLDEAKDKVLMGAERRTLAMDKDELNTTAVHEAGHALVALHLKHSDPLHKVTIVPRGRALGVTQQLPERDRYSHSLKYLNDRISIMMGGRIAEDVVLGDVTTGASNDIEVATQMARRMVCEWGMSNLGPINFGAKQGEVFLGRDYNSGGATDMSQSTAVKVDEEVRRIIESNYDRAESVLTTYRDELDLLTEALLEHETLDREEVDWVIGGKDLTELHDRRRAQKEHRAAQEPPAPRATPDAPSDDVNPMIDGLPGLPEPLPQS